MNKKKYVVMSRDDWNQKLIDQFGKERSIHELTDTEVIEAIIKHGRAEITNFLHNSKDELDIWYLDFQNGYD
jgi:hypothetical protein